MQTAITSDISRLSLHDSSFVDVVRHDQDLNLTLTFDWSSLDNFKEAGIDEAIIIGKTRIYFTGVSSEQFRLYVDNDNSKFVLLPLPSDIVAEIEVIGTSNIDDYVKTVKIGGLYKQGESYHWSEWSFRFDTCKVSWTSYVTHSEWKNGKLPAD